MKQVTPHEIVTRFLKAFDVVCAEQNETAKSLAPKINTTAEYISTIRKSKKAYIRQDILANLCVKYSISADWILTGRGEIRTDPNLTKIHQSLQRLASTQDDIIAKLLDGLLEVKARLNDPIKELTDQARKRNN